MKNSKKEFLTLAGLALLLMGFSAIAIGCANGDSKTTPKTETASEMDSVVDADTAGTETTKDKSDSAGTESMTSDPTDAGSKADTQVKYEAPIRNASNHIVKLTTTMGDLTLELFRDISPNHADSFLARVKDGFYEGTIFHRVIQNFMIQGGDPTGTGSGDASYNLNQEFNDITHERGILSMARANDPNSASCQFFVVHKKSAHLDGRYTVFGNLLAGYETLDKIATTPHKQTRPITEIKILKATVIK